MHHKYLVIVTARDLGERELFVVYKPVTIICIITIKHNCPYKSFALEGILGLAF